MEADYQYRFGELLKRLPCEISLPKDWEGFFQERGMVAATDTDQRRFVRAHLRGRGLLQIEQTLPAIPRERSCYSIFTKDVSRSGIGLLHNQQLFPGERVTIWLPTNKAPGTVVRCRRHNAACFEIGVAFGA